jgi:hypothetical protein
MNRFVLPTAAALALLAACSTQPAAERMARATPSPPNPECFDPAFARGYSVIDRDDIVVESGPRYYRLALEPTCIGTDFEVMLRFRGDPATGRVCGYFRDAILTDRGECRIDRVDRIDKAEYERLVHPERAKKAVAPAQS